VRDVIDLNCDMGESLGVYKLGFDEEVIPWVSSVNIACGFHASDPVNMQNSVRLAKQYGAAVGAHPSYPDLRGFGRRVLAASPEEIKADVIYQVGALYGFCLAEGVKMSHVKAHGALYNVAARDLQTAVAIAEAVKAIDSKLYLICLANSVMVDAARSVGVKFILEAFADREYTADGQLLSRKCSGAVIEDAQVVAYRAVQIAKNGLVKAVDGEEISVPADTICVHGDTPGAVMIVKEINQALKRAGIKIKSAIA